MLLISSQEAQAACQPVSSDTIISDNSYNCLTWSGGNLTITGSGILSGSGTGIKSSGSLGALTNSGSIGGTTYGLYNNGGSIPTITNNAGGTINGSGFIGFYNGGSIGSLINTGVITNPNNNYAGIMNDQTIDSIVNNAGGTINGFFGIINNNGSIGSLANSGLISGPYAIYNQATIATITNSGVLGNGSYGILSYASIGTVINNAGGTIGGSNAFYNGGTISSIVNNAGGTIIGSGNGNGIYNFGLIGGGTTAINSPGTIIGSIVNTGTISGNILTNQNITITGGSRNSYGSLTGGGTITANNLVFDSSSYQNLNESVINLGSGTLTNAGALRLDTAASITGNYSQNSSTGLLTFGITNAGSYGWLNASGTVNLANDTISLLALGGGSGITNGEAFTIAQGLNAGSDYSGLVVHTTGILATISSIVSGSFDDLIATLNACTNQVISSNTTLSSGVCGITWNSSDVSITGSGYVSGSATAIVNNGNSVGALTNSGSISGANYGLFNNGGTVTALTNNAGGIISGGTYGVYNSGTIGAVSNSGTISGHSYGIYSPGSIGTLTNSGSVSAYTYGVYNAGSIGTLTNSGSISGHTYGFYNNGGTIDAFTNNTGDVISAVTYGLYIGSGSIGALTNSGTIAGTATTWGGSYGLTNSGTIATLSNLAGGTISGPGYMGIQNGGSIGSIINSGVISGGSNGYSALFNGGTIIAVINNAGGTINSGNYDIQNYTYIGSIANSGVISGGYSGIYNSGTINAVANNAGGTISGGSYGLLNYSTIGSITNNGTFSGSSGGIYNQGFIGGGTTAINSPGMIIGSITNSGTINGNILTAQNISITGGSRTSYGTLTGGGTITASNLVFDSSSYQKLNESVINLGSGTLTNNGALRLDTAASITGNYSQSSSTGLLTLGITNAGSYGWLNASGTVNLANDTISLLGLGGGAGITNGEAFTIAQGLDTGTDYSGLHVQTTGILATISSIVSGGFDDLIATLNACTNQIVSSNTTLSGGVCGITWNSSDISITGSGYVSGSATAIVNNGNSVGALTNSGSISGANYGLFNNGGTVTALTNNAGGIVSGSTYGIYSSGSIGAVSNSGTIVSGGTYGFYNSGSIGILTNSGSIDSTSTSWGASYGIYNGGTIDTISNLTGGSISGPGYIGIQNNGSIGSIINSGVISGGSNGYSAIFNSQTIAAIINNAGGTISTGNNYNIYNQGSIGSIDNSGVISGGYAIYNQGTLGTLTNNAGGTITGIYSGAIYNQGTITSIINNGTFSSNGIYNQGFIGGGTTAINSTGSLGTISNAGTISGNIITAGNLAIDRTIGTLTGGTITANNLTFDAGSRQVLGDNINAGAGAGSVTNNGALQVNVAESITGSYTQGAAALLNIGVTNASTYGELIVSGAVGMTDSGIKLTDLVGGAMANGDSFTIAQGAALGTDYTGVSAFATGFLTSISSIAGGGTESLVVTLSACVNQTITSNTTFGGSACQIVWNSSNLSITGSGYVAGSTAGVINSGNIVGTLTNSGFISGSNAALWNNGGTIATFANNPSGVINDGSIGIFNDTGGSIGLIDNSGLISGTQNGIQNNGSIGTITNSGTIISGGSAGIYASIGSIGTISNSGLISAGRDEGVQVDNGATIGTITNTGTIFGNYEGIDANSGASIGLIINSGLISGNGSTCCTGISSGATIGTITNTGTITGYGSGIWNGSNGSIGTITNNGLINTANEYSNGYAGAVANDGTINAVINNGTIRNDVPTFHPGRTAAAIWNGGSIGTIANSGTISGAQSGIGNSGIIGTLSNSGLLIGGVSAINSTGVIGAITNSGTISGNINANQNLTITGGNSSTIGTLKGGTISASNLTFDSSAYQLLADDITAAAATNNGTILIDATHSITGNYTQGAAASLLVNVANASTYGNLIVSGNATLLNSDIILAGALSSGETFTIVQDAGTADYSGVAATAGGFLTSVSSIAGSLVVSLTCSAQTISADTTFGGNACQLVWNGGNLSITGSGVVSGATTAIVNAGNSVGALTNSGSITGSTSGLWNNGGTITTITNNAGGSINGGSIGILNDTSGSIGLIANSGLISGTQYGIENNSGVLGTITNSGTISGGTGAGILHGSGSIGTISNSGFLSGGEGINVSIAGSIGTISNSGTITGIYEGINSAGSIGLISNSGFISGGSACCTAISNNSNGTIGKITNTGTITGYDSGIWNGSGGSIGTITNNGLINTSAEGGSGYAAVLVNQGTTGTVINNGTIINGDPTFHAGQIEAGVFNSAVIGTLTNAGTISGLATGIKSTGTIGTLSNSGLIIGGVSAINSTGTIAGALTNSGTISGNVNASQDLTITGGNSATIGSLTGGTIGASNLTFNSSAYQLLADDITAGAGAGTVTNSGTLLARATHSISGNYTQNPAGVLAVNVANASTYGNLVVSGNATMTDSHILLSGALAAGETFTIVQDAGTADYTGVAATATGFTASVSSITSGLYDDLLVALSAAANTYHSIGVSSGNSAAAVTGAALDQIQQSGNPAFTPLFTTLNALPAGQAQRTALMQLSPNQISTQIAVSNTLMNRNIDVISQHAYALSGTDYGTTGIASGAPYRSGAFWGQLVGGLANHDNTADAAGYHENFAGTVFGADRHISDDTTAGAALGWMKGWASGTDSMAGSGLVTNSVQATVYGTHRFGAPYVSAIAGAAYNMFNENRYVGFLHEDATANYRGMQYMARAEGGWDLPMRQDVTLTPLTGLQGIYTDNNGYSETGAGVADQTVGRQTAGEVTTLLGGRITAKIPTVWGTVTPQAKIVWEHDLQQGPVSTPALMGGVSFTTSTPREAPDGAAVTLGMTLQKSDNFSLRFEYNGDLRHDYQTHSGDIKATWNF